MFDNFQSHCEAANLRFIWNSMHKKQRRNASICLKSGSRVVEVVNQMRGLGDTVSEQMVVGKVLRSLGPKYNHVVATIELSLPWMSSMGLFKHMRPGWTENFSSQIWRTQLENNNEQCLIKDKETYVLAKVQMTPRRMFPLHVRDVQHTHVANYNSNTSMLWHQHYDHLHVKGLQLLSQKGLVKGLPSINPIGSFEYYAYGKQTQEPFHKDIVSFYTS